MTIDGLSWGAIYALVAVGYTLVFGVLRLINFAHSEIFMLGMFGAYFALDILMGFTPSGNAYNKGIALTVLYLGVAMLFAMLVSRWRRSAWSSSPTGRCVSATPGR